MKGLNQGIRIIRQIVEAHVQLAVLILKRDEFQVLSIHVSCTVRNDGDILRLSFQAHSKRIDLLCVTEARGIDIALGKQIPDLCGIAVRECPYEEEKRKEVGTHTGGIILFITKWKWASILKWGLLIFLLYEVIGGLLPSAIHLKSKSSDVQEFSTASCYGESEGPERVLCIDDNTDALVWRLRVIAGAEEELILSTFDMMDDSSGTDVMSALYDAAQRGVRVRILVDGITGLVHLRNSEVLAELLAAPNVEMKFYNPVNVLKPWKYTFRLHDKYLIADDRMYISGGRNTYDLFLGNYSTHANEDRDLLIYETDPERQDTSIVPLKEYFEKLWASSNCRNYALTGKDGNPEQLGAHFAQVQKQYPEAYQTVDYEAETMPTNKVTYLAHSMDAGIRRPELFEQLTQLMTGQEQVTIQTPYIVCSADMYDALAEIADTSDRLEIITNAVESGANPWGCTDYLNEKNHILNTGAVVYEYLGAHSSHHKTILINDRISIVGSYNLDMRSTYLDTEMMLVVDSPELNEYLKTNVETEKSYSKCVAEDAADSYGENYQERELSGKKKWFYRVLRVLILPFRHAL